MFQIVIVKLERTVVGASSVLALIIYYTVCKTSINAYLHTQKDVRGDSI